MGTPVIDMKGFALLLGSVCVLGIAAYVAYNGKNPAPQPEAASEKDQHTGLPEAEPPLDTALGQPEERVVQSTDRSPLATARSTVDAHNQQPPLAPTAADNLARKYAHLTTQETKEIREQVIAEFKAEQTRLFQELYDAGFYTSYPYEYDDEGNVKTPDSYVVIPADMSPLLKQWFASPSALEWRLVAIPIDTFPEIYEMFDEWRWVKKHLRPR